LTIPLQHEINRREQIGAERAGGTNRLTVSEGACREGTERVRLRTARCAGAWEDVVEAKIGCRGNIGHPGPCVGVHGRFPRKPAIGVGTNRRLLHNGPAGWTDYGVTKPPPSMNPPP